MRYVATARTGLIAAAIAVMVVGLALPTSAAARETSDASGSWTMRYLPMPTGHEDARGYVTGTNSKGVYSGFIGTELGPEVVTWKGGKATLHGAPAGFEHATAWDQNSSGTIVGEALDSETGEARPFTLDGSKFRVLPLPEGFSSLNVRAMNEPGDIVGIAFPSDDGNPSAAVLWPASDYHSPVILDLNLPSADVRDIDDDGTILVDSYEAGPHLWRDGVLQTLAVPDGYTQATVQAIRKGRVVGHASSEADPGGQGFLWVTPADPRPLRGSTTASNINAFGLIAGREASPTSHQGTLAVWLGTYSAGRLQMPEGYNGAAGVVGDDGTIAGHVSTQPLDEGGRPVVWRYTN